MTVYEVVIVWESGEKETYTRQTREEAQNIADNYRRAFGNQIAFTGITRKEK